MLKKPYEMTSAQWYRAYEQLKDGPNQVKFTRAGASQAVASFNALETLRFGVRHRFSQQLKDASKGLLKISRHRADRLLTIVQKPVDHRDVVVAALKQNLEVPAEVLVEYPELALRRYRRRPGSTG